jgi:hypothetical protein
MVEHDTLGQPMYVKLDVKLVISSISNKSMILDIPPEMQSQEADALMKIHECMQIITRYPP